MMERLAELRERRALTLRELAAMSGVAADTINQIELGHRKPRPSTLRKLARALEVDVEEFYEEPIRPKVSAAPPSLEWALAASDKEFDNFIRTATLPEAMELLPLNLRAKDTSGDERIRILERVSKILSRILELGGPYALAKDWEDRSARDHQERQETA
jgi:transcriptional regulator with XRE-family HTH domain